MTHGIGRAYDAAHLCVDDHARRAPDLLGREGERMKTLVDIAARSSPEQALDQLLPCDAEVLRNVTKDTG